MPRRHLVINILPRSEWTSTDPGWWRTPPYVDPIGIACHWPASGKIGTAKSAVAAALRSWRNYHVDTRGWPDIGYNYAVDQAGRAWELAGKRTAAHCASAANPDANADWFGVLFVLGMDETLSEAAIATFVELRAEIAPGKRVEGHQDVPGASTACPGPSVMGAIRDGRLTGIPGSTKNVQVDGKLGESSIEWTQRRLKEAGRYDGAIDGRIDHQNPHWKDDNSAFTTGWDWDPDYRDHDGSATIHALWAVITDKGIDAGADDGLVGPKFNTGWQTYLTDHAKYDERIDGEFWYGGTAAKSHQKVLNSKRGFIR
ncbi:peptidoglycan recognition family protein [Isoptericola halotolerans]|uniref:peptidoglycan recognition protein family protein n=1 Tax=Isoptericola halotolerans TaxID=300560 RepID=UPI00388EAE18